MGPSLPHSPPFAQEKQVKKHGTRFFPNPVPHVKLTKSITKKTTPSRIHRRCSGLSSFSTNSQAHVHYLTEVLSLCMSLENEPAATIHPGTAVTYRRKFRVATHFTHYLSPSSFAFLIHPLPSLPNLSNHQPRTLPEHHPHHATPQIRLNHPERNIQLPQPFTAEQSTVHHINNIHPHGQGRRMHGPTH